MMRPRLQRFNLIKNMIMGPTSIDNERARAWWEAVSQNKLAEALTPAEQLALISWTKFLPHIIGYITHPIAELQRAALSSLMIDHRYKANNPSASLAIAQLTKTPDKFDAALLEEIKPGLAMLVERSRTSPNFAEILSDFLDDIELEGEYD